MPPGDVYHLQGFFRICSLRSAFAAFLSAFLPLLEVGAHFGQEMVTHAPLTNSVTLCLHLAISCSLVSVPNFDQSYYTTLLF